MERWGARREGETRGSHLRENICDQDQTGSRDQVDL